MAYSRPQQGGGEETARLRKAAGAKLKSLREELGKTQQEIAKEVGFDYYTMVSQIEGGKVRVPPLQMVAYAKALNQRPRDFTKLMMQFYDPVTFEILFTDRHDPTPILDQLK